MSGRRGTLTRGGSPLSRNHVRHLAAFSPAALGIQVRRGSYVSPGLGEVKRRVAQGDVVMRFTVPARPEATQACRAALQPMEMLVDDEALDRLRLLTTELVTNSVRHAGLTPNDLLTVEITLVDGDRLRVEVSDDGNGFEPPASITPKEDSGWGLFLVENLTNRWGTNSRGRGTTVWFEIPCAPQAATT